VKYVGLVVWLALVALSAHLGYLISEKEAKVSAPAAVECPDDSKLRAELNSYKQYSDSLLFHLRDQMKKREDLERRLRAQNATHTDAEVKSHGSH
jgi:hypothetical protein